MDDKKKNLYDALSEDYDLGTFESFSAALDDENNRRNLFDAASADYDLGDYESFSAALGYGASASTAPKADERHVRMESLPEGEPIEDVTEPVDPVQPRYINEIDAENYDANLAVNPGLRFQNQSRYDERLMAGEGELPTDARAQMMTDYAGSASKNASDYVAAAQTNQYNRDVNRIQSLQQDIEKLEAGKRAARKEDDKALKKDYKAAVKEREAQMGEAVARMENNPVFEAQRESISIDADNKIAALGERRNAIWNDISEQVIGNEDNTDVIVSEHPELNSIEAAQRLYDDAKRVANSPLQKDGKNVGVFMKGMGEDMVNPDFWTLGVTDISDMKVVRKALENLASSAEKGANLNNVDIESANISDDDKSVLDAYFTLNAANMLRSMDMNNIYNAGISAAESLKFALEIGLASGLSSKAAEAVSKPLAKALSKKVSSIAAKNIAGKVGKYALKQGSKLTTGAVKALTKAGVTTVLQPLTIETGMNYATQLDEHGRLQSVGKMMFEAGVDQFIENFTESGVGELPGAILGEGANLIGRGMNAAGAGAAVRAIKNGGARLVASRVGNVLVKGGKSMKNFGWNNFGEYFEELVNADIERLRGNEGAVDDFFKVGNLLDMTYTFAPMAIIGVGSGAVNTGRSIHYSRQLKNVEQQLRTIVGDSEMKDRGLDEFFNKYYRRLDSRVGGVDRRVTDENGNQVPMGYEQSYSTTSKDMVTDFLTFYKAVENANPGMSASEKADVISKINDFVSDFQKASAVRGLEDAKKQADGEQILEGAKKIAGKDLVYRGTESPGYEYGILTLRDGSEVFMVGDAADGKIPYVSADTGIHGYVDLENCVNLRWYKPGEYQLELGEQKRAADEQSRIDAETQGQISAVKDSFLKDYNVQSDITQLAVSLRPQASQNGHAFVDAITDSGVVVIWENGASDRLTWEEIAPAYGATIEVKTDEQLENEAADELGTMQLSREQIAQIINDGIRDGIVLNDGTEIVGIITDSIDTDRGTARIVLRDANGERTITGNYNPILDSLAEKNQRYPEDYEEVEDMPEEIAGEAPAAPAAPAYETPMTEDGEIDWDRMLAENPAEFARQLDEAYGGDSTATKEALAAVIKDLNDQKKKLKATEVNKRVKIDKEIKRYQDVLDSYEQNEEASKVTEALKKRIASLVSDMKVIFGMKDKKTGKESSYGNIKAYVDKAESILEEEHKNASEADAPIVEAKQAEFDAVSDAMNEVEAELPDINGKDAKVTKADLEPRTPIEVAAKLISDGTIRLNKDDYAKETGHDVKSPEVKSMWRLFRKNGMSIAAAGEAVESYINSGVYEGSPIPENTDGRNIVLDLLGECRNIYDIFGYIRNARKAENKRSKADNDARIAEEIKNEWGCTVDEYNEQLDAQRKILLGNKLGITDEEVKFDHTGTVEEFFEDMPEDIAEEKTETEAPVAETPVEEPESPVEEAPVNEIPEVETPETTAEGENTEKGGENNGGNTSESVGESVTSQGGGYGSGNKLVTNARYEELKKKMREKLGQLNVGFDPEMFALGAEMAAYHIEAGARKFIEYAKKMIADLGDVIRPYLKSFYNGARDLPGMEEVAGEMDSAETVRSIDVNAIDINENTEDNGTEETTDGDADVPAGGSQVGDSGDMPEGPAGEVPGDTDGGTAGTGTETGGSGSDTEGGLFAEDEEGDNGENGGGKANGTAGSGESSGAGETNTGGKGTSSGNSGRPGTGGKGHSSNGGKRPGKKSGSAVGTGSTGTGLGLTEEAKEYTDEELASMESESEKATSEKIQSETDIDKLKKEAEAAKKAISEAEDRSKEKAQAEGRLKAINARLRALFEEKNKKTTDIEAEKVAYVSVSDPEGKHAIGSVVPSGSAESIHNALKNVEKIEGKPMAEFVKDELGYKSLDDMFTTADVKATGLSSEQVDGVGLAISNMKRKKMCIIGDQTGIGKGREAAALIRWAVRNKKRVLFVTEKPKLFSRMYEDLMDIGSDGLKPLCIADQKEAHIIVDGEVKFKAPGAAQKKTLFASGKVDPVIVTRGKTTTYDFVMTTYDQVGSDNTASAKARRDWIAAYAKDAIVIMDESHNAGGMSNRGEFFRDVAVNAEGVTFLSATYAKRPENMYLYAKRSSISELGMTDEQLINSISQFGVPMMELMAESLFAGGEMIRRERDMTGVETNWPTTEEVYSKEEIERARETYDAAIDVVSSIIDFQRHAVNPTISKMNKDDFEEHNKQVAKNGDGWLKSYVVTSYKSQLSAVTKLLLYASKLKKTADLAIEQIKKGEKPIITVDNTLESYIRELPDGDIADVDFSSVLQRGYDNSLKYRLREQLIHEGKPVPEDEGGVRITEMGSIESSIPAANLAWVKEAEQELQKYIDNENIDHAPLSPIDYIKRRIEEAGYSVGEITGRSVGLEQNPDGNWHKVKITQNAKEVVRRFNGGSILNPVKKEDRLDAVIINRAGSTGESMHASQKFGDQSQRDMDILQAAENVDTEVQTRGRIDRTGQVKRGRFIYMPSPIPVENKRTMSLKRKLRKLDASTVGTDKVSSNKVEAEDMENKYGDMVAYDYLKEHLQDINSLLGPDGLRQDKNGEWWAQNDQMHRLLIGMQLLHCEDQEIILKDLEERYIAKIQYLNENGVNDLESTVLKLDAEKINDAVFIPGVDNSSPASLMHDALIERVMVNTLKKHLTSDGIHEEMKRIGSLDSDGKVNSLYGHDVTTAVDGKCQSILDELKEKHEKKEAEMLEHLRAKNPKPTVVSEEDYEKTITNMPQILELKAKNAVRYSQKVSELEAGKKEIGYASMYLKAGKLYLVPLTDDYGQESRSTYGRFIGFKLGDKSPRSVKAVFAVRDSRAKIEIPIASMPGIAKHIVDTTNASEISDLGRYETDPMPTWDKKWDSVSPKNTARQKRYMLTGNIVVAADKLGKYKGRITTFTRKNAETGEITVDRGMLLTEDFDPDAFLIKRPWKLSEIWDSDQQAEDKDEGIKAFRSGDYLVVTFSKKGDTPLSRHRAYKDKGLHALAVGGKIHYSSRDMIEFLFEKDKAEEALKYLETKYGFMASEQFVMPDDPDRVDRIVPDSRPYKDIIAELSPKLGVTSLWGAEIALERAMKKYQLDAEDEENNQKIHDLVTIRQAYYRKEAASYDDDGLAWETIIYQEKRENPNKEIREEANAKFLAYADEMTARGLGDKQRHFEQGDYETEKIESLFNEFNEDKTNAAIAKKVFKIAKTLHLQVQFADKVTRSAGAGTAGGAAGYVVRYNWKYFNSAYISKQQKANTILHELIHTLTVYAITATESQNEHLLTNDMIDRLNELSAIYRAIKWEKAFQHKNDSASYVDYGVTNNKEMLSELASNEGFRKDMDQVKLVPTQKYGTTQFTVAKDNAVSGTTVTAKDAVMEILNFLLDNFNADAMKELYRGTYGTGGAAGNWRSVDSVLDNGDAAERYSFSDKSYPDKSDRESIIGAAEVLEKDLNTDIVIVESAPERARRIDGQMREPNGWYDIANDKVYLNLGAMENVEDAQCTILHEVVAHRGLRAMFGEKFDQFLDRVYGKGNKGIRARIEQIMSERGLDRRTATEEYLAELAEDGFENVEERNFFQKVRDLFVRMLHSAGIYIQRISDDELSYILWSSKRNLETSDPIEVASRISSANRLRVNAENSHVKEVESVGENQKKSNFVNDENAAQKDLSSGVGGRDNGRSEGNARMGLVPDSAEARASWLGGTHLLPLVRAVEALRKDSTGRTRKPSTNDVERALIDAAKASGLYVDYDDFVKEHGKKDSWGAESEVWFKDGKAIKLTLPFFSLEFRDANRTDVLNNIIAHNILFPDTAYELKGISYDGLDSFLILSQDQVDISSSSPTKELMEDTMAQLGFRKLNFLMYEGHGVVVSDIAPGNMVIDSEGNPRVIDCNIYLPDGEDPLTKLYKDMYENPDGPHYNGGGNGGSSMDDAFRAAYERGDEETARRMVAEAFKRAYPDAVFGSKIFYHNTPNKFTSFDESLNGTHNDAGWLGDGFYFYGDVNEGSGYGKNKMSVFLDIEEPYIASGEENSRLAEVNSREESISFRENIEDEGYDGVFYNGDLREEAVAFYPSQIKSADPFTFDDKGELIPLSERFNPENDDIRYSYGTRDSRRRMRLQSRKPARSQRRVKEIITTNDLNNQARHFYEKHVLTTSALIREQYLDLYEPVRIAVEAIVDESGREMEDYENFNLQASALPRKNVREREKMDKEYLVPMREIIKKVIEENDEVEYDDVVEYASLKHGLERNKFMATKKALEDYTSEYEEKKAKIDHEIEKLMKDQSKVDPTDTDKLDEIKAKIEELTEDLSDLKDIYDQHRKKLVPEEYYTEQYEKGLAKIEADLSLTHAEKEHKKELLQIAYDNRMEDIREHPEVYERIRETDAKYKDYRKVDYAAVQSWFAKYFDGDVELDETPAKEAEETELEYRERLHSMRRLVDEAKTVAGAEQLAEDWIEEFERKVGRGDIAGLWARINAATGAILDHQLASHMISRKQRESLGARFKYYVPLRGFADPTAGQLWSYEDEDLSGDFSAPLLPMQGRHSKPAAPFAYIESMAASAIHQDNRNNLLRVLYKFVQNRKDNSLITIADTWYEKTGEKDDKDRDIWRPTAPVIRAGMTQEQEENAKKSFEETMKMKAAAGEAVKGSRGVELRGGVAHITTKEADSHIVRIHVLGEEKFLVFNANPRAAQALNGLLNADANGAAEKILGIASGVTRYMSLMNTGLRPAFWVGNFAKDTVTGLINVGINEDAAYTAKYELNRGRILSMLLPTMMKDGEYTENPDWSASHKARAKKYADLYKMYLDNGGPSGFATLSSMDFYENEVQKFVGAKTKDTADRAKEVWEMMQKMSKIGELLEQVPRFAVFLTSYKEGRSVERCIHDAKDVTLNFNQKGASTGASMKYISTLKKMKRDGKLRDLTAVERVFVWCLANFSPVAKSLYMFHNPAVQSVDKIIRNFKAHGVKSTIAVVALVGLGYANHMLRAALDPDDDDKYTAMSKYRRRHNIVGPKVRGIDVLWPMSQEYAPMYALGDILASIQLRENGPLDNPGKEVADEILALLPINPGEKNSFVPDAIVPFVEAINNTNFMGGKLYNDSDYMDEYPEYTKAYSQTWDWMIWTSESLNRLTGGDYAKKGAIDFNPAKVQHVIEGLGGGFVTDVFRSEKAVESLISGMKPRLRDFPSVSRFLYNPEEYRDSQVLGLFNQYKTVGDDAQRLMKDYEKAGDSARIGKLMNSDDYKYHLVWEDDYKDEMSELNKLYKSATLKSDKDAVNGWIDALKGAYIEDCEKIRWGE